MRQVGESKGGDGRPESSSGTEEMRGCWDLNKERLLKNPSRTRPPGEQWRKAAGSAPRIAARYQPGERGAPRGVSTADSGGGGPRRMTLHLARGSSLRAPSAPGPVSTADSASRPRARRAQPAGPARAPSPPPLPLKNELVSLLLWGWIFFCLFLSFFFFALCCVCVFLKGTRPRVPGVMTLIGSGRFWG